MENYEDISSWIHKGLKSFGRLSLDEMEAYWRIMAKGNPPAMPEKDICRGILENMQRKGKVEIDNRKGVEIYCFVR